MAIVTRIFRTVGPLAGQDVTLMGLEFVAGEHVFHGSESDALGIGTYLNRCWEVETIVPDAAVGAPPTTDEETPNPAQVLVLARLEAALRKLDPNNDEHWTKSGKPAVAAVEQFYGSADITRTDIEAAIPDFDRAAALAGAA